MVSGTGVAVRPEVITEREVFGVTYERYALQKLCARLVKKHNLTTILELPTVGAKAMPGLYSVGFALAGCQVTLVEPDSEAAQIWRELGLGNRLTCLHREELISAIALGQRWDLVWNFAVLPSAANPAALVQEMAGASRKWLMIAAVNRFNVGFNLHQTVHRLYHIPWSHGDVRFFSPYYTKDFLRQRGFKGVRWGVVDCPPWPDSPGFRDLRLHRQGDRQRHWVSPYVDYLQRGAFPAWMKYVYWGERLPIPNILKLPYAHLYFALGQIGDEITR
jgi:hypothetical protein